MFFLVHCKPRNKTSLPNQTGNPESSLNLNPVETDRLIVLVPRQEIRDSLAKSKTNAGFGLTGLHVNSFKAISAELMDRALVKSWDVPLLGRKGRFDYTVLEPGKSFDKGKGLQTEKTFIEDAERILESEGEITLNLGKADIKKVNSFVGDIERQHPNLRVEKFTDEGGDVPSYRIRLIPKNFLTPDTASLMPPVFTRKAPGARYSIEDTILRLNDGEFVTIADTAETVRAMHTLMMQDPRTLEYEISPIKTDGTFTVKRLPQDVINKHKVLADGAREDTLYFGLEGLDRGQAPRAGEPAISGADLAARLGDRFLASGLVERAGGGGGRGEATNVYAHPRDIAEMEKSGQSDFDFVPIEAENLTVLLRKKIGEGADAGGKFYRMTLKPTSKLRTLHFLRNLDPPAVPHFSARFGGDPVLEIPARRVPPVGEPHSIINCRQIGAGAMGVAFKITVETPGQPVQAFVIKEHANFQNPVMGVVDQGPDGRPRVMEQGAYDHTLRAVKEEVDQGSAMNAVGVGPRVYGLTRNRPGIIMEAMETDGTHFLDGFPQDAAVRRQSPMVKQTALTLAEEMGKFANARWVHNDIKSDNFLIRRTGPGDMDFRAVLSDFGESSADVFDPGNIKTGNTGHTPPELKSITDKRVLPEGYDLRQADVYALGLMIMELRMPTATFRPILASGESTAIQRDAMAALANAGGVDAVLKRMVGPWRERYRSNAEAYAALKAAYDSDVP
jgi:hypothetical protein